VSFQAEAAQRFAPSMRQRIDVGQLFGQLYRSALRQAAKLHEDGREQVPWPDTCPFTLDQLLTEDTEGLEACLTVPSVA
jgi:Domain of unknown function DUF29